MPTTTTQSEAPAYPHPTSIAERFAIESATREAVEERVLGILCSRLLIGGRGQDQTVKMLDAPGPTRCHGWAWVGKLTSEPVQQFGVRGSVAGDAEVAGGCDDSLAEVLLPDAVHHDAGR